jgi:hypothetical protein
MKLLAEKDGFFDLRLAHSELVMAHNAMNEICNIPTFIEDCEFRTRLGFTRDQIRQLLAQTGACLGNSN